MKKLPAEFIYYLRNAVSGFASGLIFTSIWVLYYTVMELSMLQVSLLFVVLAVTSLVFEIPTGVLVDVYSRRLSVIAGGIFMGCAYVLIGAFSIFVIVLLAGFIEAVGDTFISGALQAWITDEVGEDNVYYPERSASVALLASRFSPSA